MMELEKEMLGKIISDENLEAAFERVRDSHGCADVDGIDVESYAKHLYQNLGDLRMEILQSTYSPLPLLQILVEKKNGGARKLSIPAVRDRVIQAATLRLIGPILEKQFDDCSYVYGEGHSVRQALDKVRQHRDAVYRWVVDADIEAFFDHVDHSLLMDDVSRLLDDSRVKGLIGQLIAADVWDGKSGHKISQGIPQGSPISHMLASNSLGVEWETILHKG